MNKRKTFLLLIVSLIILTSCSNFEVKKEKIIDLEKINEINRYAESNDGKLTVPIYNLKSINPLLESDKSFYYFSQLIYEGLFGFDENLNIKGVLAESYEVQNNGKTYLIKLRKNVLWHNNQNNGTEKFTAEDVEFSLNILKYNPEKSFYGKIILESLNMTPKSLNNDMKLTIIDDYTIKINFSKSYSNALEIMTFPILSKNQYYNGGSIKKAYNKALSEKLEFIPNGTGPYKITRYNKLKEIELVANDKWWNKKPSIKRIVGLIIKDKELFKKSFENGKIDLTYTEDITWDKYFENDNLKKFEYVSPKYEFLGFNFKNDLFNSGKGKAIRKAIAYSLDLNSIIEKVYLGNASQTDVPVPTNSWLFSQDHEYYGNNKQKSLKILKDFGFIDSNGDGILEDLNGNKLSFRLLTNSDNKNRVKTAEMIANNIKQIGIEVIIDKSSWGELNNKISNKDFDFVLLGWELSLIPDLSFAFHSSNIENGHNFISYSNYELDKYLDEAKFAKDRESKKLAYNNIQKIIADELPYISLFFSNASVLVNDKLEGNLNPQPFNIYYNLYNCNIRIK